jgi:hypothetical protein
MVRALLGTGLLLIAGALGACGSVPPPPGATPAVTGAAQATQVSDGGQVTVRATWQGRDAGPVFTIVLDTHSVDIDAFDLAKLATLKTDDGRTVDALGWDAPPGGHHRTGTLTFPTAIGGAPVIGPTTRAVELVVRDVAGIPERRFRWPL